MKKLLSLLISCALAFSLTACSGGVSQEEYDKVVAENKMLKSVSVSGSATEIAGYLAPNYQKTDESQSIILYGTIKECFIRKKELLTPIIITVNFDNCDWEVTSGFTEYNCKEVMDMLIGKEVTVLGKSIVQSHTVIADAILWNGKCFSVSEYNDKTLITEFNNGG